MTAPTIHMNGTSRDGLMEPLETASNALNDAYEALKQTAPNGRDYYPQGPEALSKATADHMGRLARLDSIKQEIDDLAFAISQS